MFGVKKIIMAFGLISFYIIMMYCIYLITTSFFFFFFCRPCTELYMHLHVAWGCQIELLWHFRSFYNMIYQLRTFSWNLTFWYLIPWNGGEGIWGRKGTGVKEGWWMTIVFLVVVGGGWWLEGNVSGDRPPIVVEVLPG